MRLEPESPSTPLAQRLRRIGLLEDDRTLPELNHARIPLEIQQTLLDPSKTRDVIRHWINRRRSSTPITTTESLIVLSHLLRRPHQAGPLVKTIPYFDYPRAVAESSLVAARRLFDDGRSTYAQARVDTSINLMLEAQHNFILALNTGRLPQHDHTEAMGKYAVAVIFSSRWGNTPVEVLTRARLFQEESIAAGNRGPEAYAYLVELITLLFDSTSDEIYLTEALALARQHRLVLDVAELLLKRGLLRHRDRLSRSIQDYQDAKSLARRASPATGVDYVRRALIDQFAHSAMFGLHHLDSTQLRLPYGFLPDLPQLSDQQRRYLDADIREALMPMREFLQDQNRPPNLVAQQVLYATLRSSILQGDYSSPDHELIVDITRESLERGSERYLAYQHVDAFLVRATSHSRPDDVRAAIQQAEGLVGRYPEWPLPRVTLAKALTLDADAQESVQSHAAAQQAWIDAVRRIVESPDYRRSDLGGRSSVFAIEDARGDLSSALVFKPVINAAHAQREAEHMRLLQESISANGMQQRFGVSNSLAIVSLSDGQSVHVIEREVGPLLSEVDIADARRMLDSCVDLTALFHKAVPVIDRDRSGWPKLKNDLKLCAPTIFSDQGSADEFISAMKDSLPADLPLVRRRDAHAGNWVVAGGHRLVAIDLEAASLLPIGHDIAQLIEDFGLVPVGKDGFGRRRELMSRYLNNLCITDNEDDTILAYDWFALLRAVWVASSAHASRFRHSHARQLAQFISVYTEWPGLRIPAEMLTSALRSYRVEDKHGALDGAHRRLSKQLARLLRHYPPRSEMAVDGSGFVELIDVANELGRTVEEVVSVATHPAEPRFQVEDGRIRALYGHSFYVEDLSDLGIEPPRILFHGTSWDSLSSIVVEGLRPMHRQKVHLTNNPNEALEVARRHSRPALVAVRAEEVESLQAVADAVWAADYVDPDLLEVRNPVRESSLPPAWMFDSITRRG